MQITQLTPYRWVGVALVLALVALALPVDVRATPARPAAPRPGAPAQYLIGGVVGQAARTRVAASGAAIDQIGPDWLLVSASPTDLSRLLATGFRVQPTLRDQAVACPAADPAFHTYSDLTGALEQTTQVYPTLVQRFSIGQSFQGRALWAVKISDNVATDEDEPEALFVGLYHAREHLTTEMMLYLLDLLVDGYGSDPQITSLVDSREIYLIFQLNPDGGEFDTLDGICRSWRKNRQPNPNSGCVGTDLNRNHSYGWGGPGASDDPCSLTYRGATAASAPEIQAIEQFVTSRVVGGVQQIRVAISFHTYSELVLWPYGYTNEDMPADMQPDDQAAFVAMGTAMARSNGYRPMQSSDLYLTSGDFSDWAYGNQRIFAFTFEMYPRYEDPGFYPPASVIARETARNRGAVLYLLEQAACPYAAIGKQIQYCAPHRLWLPVAAG